MNTHHFHRALARAGFVAGLSGALLVAACDGAGKETAEHAQVSSPALSVEIASAQLLRNGQTLSLSWRVEGGSVPVDVYLATSPDANAEHRLISDDDADGAHVFDAAATPRPYVFLQPAAGGEGVWVAERVLPLEGGHNFRDLGGYETADGGRVKWGSLFRSGTMVRLTEHDYHYLQSLDIAVICDLRANEEREQEPTQWQRVNPEMEYLSWDYPMSGIAGAWTGLGERPEPAKVLAMFQGVYREMPQRFAEHYAAMFEHLIAGDVPLAVNCSAGKDRTGGAAALILTALGVPREQVIEDYALTEKLTNHERHERDFADKVDEDSDYAALAKWPAASLKVLMGSDPALIRAMFESIESKYGTVENYLDKALGVDQKDLATLRRRYVDGPHNQPLRTGLNGRGVAPATGHHPRHAAARHGR